MAHAHRPLVRRGGLIRCGGEGRGREPQARRLRRDREAPARGMGADRRNAPSATSMHRGIVQRIGRRFGRIDVVNNADRARPCRSGSFTPEAWRSRTTSIAGRSSSSGALPHLKASRGNILNVLSVALAFVFSGNVCRHYAGRRVGAARLSASTAAEFGTVRRARANALAPGTNRHRDVCAPAAGGDRRDDCEHQPAGAWRARRDGPDPRCCCFHPVATPALRHRSGGAVRRRRHGPALSREGLAGCSARSTTADRTADRRKPIAKFLPRSDHGDWRRLADLLHRRRRDVDRAGRPAFVGIPAPGDCTRATPAESGRRARTGNLALNLWIEPEGGTHTARVHWTRSTSSPGVANRRPEDRGCRRAPITIECRTPATGWRNRAARARRRPAPSGHGRERRDRACVEQRRRTHSRRRATPRGRPLAAQSRRRSSTRPSSCSERRAARRPLPPVAPHRDTDAVARLHCTVALRALWSRPLDRRAC